MKQGRWVPVALAIILIGVAFLRNRSLTRDLEWPAFDAQYREVATSQTLLDSGYGPDPSYAHEHLWYNPLTSLILAAVSQAVGESLHVLAPRLGPFINILAPLAFFVLMLVLVDAWTAFAGTAGFVFVWGSLFLLHVEAATYSPWLLPSHFTQGLFYLGLVGILWARSAPASPLRYGLVGVVLGATFLGHTAPAVILGLIMVVACLADIRTHGGGVGRSLLALAAGLGAALIVSMPVLYWIGWKYSFHVVNIEPGTGNYSRLDPNELVGFLKEQLNLPVALGAAGGLFYAWKRRWEAKGQILLTWLAVCLGFVLYHEIRVLGGKVGLALPTIVPSWHFVAYLHGWLAVGFGLAIVEIARWTAPRMPVFSEKLLVCAITGVFVAVYVPVRLQKEHAVRAEALALARVLPTDAFAWIQEHTSPSDVFLSTDQMSLFVVNPAGRKVIATDRFFSNPYVDWTERDRDRKELFAFLARRDHGGFDAAAKKYGVKFVIWSDSVAVKTRGTLGMHPPPNLTTEDIEATGLARVFRGNEVAIFRVRG